MRKIILNLFLVIVSIPLIVCAKNTFDALEKIDTDKLTNLEINYNYDNYEFNDISVKIYYIASIDENFQYNLENDFKKYNINLNRMKTNDNFNVLKSTLESYIKADNIKELHEYFIKNNKINMNDLKAGLYLIETEKIIEENYTLLFDSFLLNIPDLNELGYWNYDVKVFPKAKTFTPNYELINYTVTKEWNDDKSIRPKSVEVEIYRDGTFAFEQILSSENNWTYEWQTIDDGSIWNVVERNVLDEYSVSILNNERNFIVVNTSNYKEKNPQTLDNIKIYFYLFISSFIGLFLLLIVLLINKKKEL